MGVESHRRDVPRWFASVRNAASRVTRRFWLSGLVIVALGLLIWLGESPAADFIGGAGLVVIGWSILASVPAVREHYLLSMFRPISGDVDPGIRAVAEQTARQRLSGICVAPGEQIIELATVIDEALAAHSTTHPLLAGSPIGKASAERVLQAARLAGSGRAISAIARVTYPQESAELAAHQRDVARLVQPLAELRPLPRHTPAPSAERELALAEFATWLAGAPILVDAMDSRYRVFSDICTWHRRWYRGRGQHRRYDDAHGHRDECQTTLGVGDHDARVVDVHGIWRGVNPEAGRLAVVLETGESCYGATENTMGAGIACKHLTPTPYGLPGHESGVALLPFGVDLNGATRYPLGAGPIRMLTAYSVLRTVDDYLVLAQRSKGVRSGLGVLSATAGGVVEVRDLQLGGDLGSQGSLDIARAAARETAEEIGVALDPERLRPMMVFLANSVGRNEAEMVEGQVVVTTLLLARTRLTFAEVQMESAHGSDLALGSYELDRLEPCPIRNADSVATWCGEQASRIDQHALLACLYASAVLFGEQTTIGAFLAAFADAPWWLHGLDERGWPRNCFDPGQLLQPSAGVDETARRLEAIEPAWRTVWERSQATERRSPTAGSDKPRPSGS